MPGASGTAVAASGCRVSAVRTCGDLSSGAFTSGAVLPLTCSGFAAGAAGAGALAASAFALASAAARSASALLRIGVFGS